MKNIATILPILLILFFAAPASRGGGISVARTEGWGFDLDSAKRKAAKADLDLLIYVNGASWCEESTAVYFDIFNKDIFKKWVEPRFIPVELNIQRPFRSPEQADIMKKLRLDFDDLPVIFLALKDGSEYAAVPCRGGNAEAFLDLLESVYRRRGPLSTLLEDISAAGDEPSKFDAIYKLARTALDWGLPNCWEPYARDALTMQVDGNMDRKLFLAAALAGAEVERGEYGSAGKIVSAFAGAETGDAFVLRSFARVAYYLQRYDEAYGLYARAWAGDVSAYETVYEWFELMLRTGRRSDAKGKLATVEKEMNHPYHANQLKTRYVDPFSVISDWRKAEKRFSRNGVKPPRVLVETEHGNFTIELFYENAPNTSENFLWLISKKRYYDGIKFHHVRGGDMAVAGDKLTRTDEYSYNDGTGPPPHYLKNELKAPFAKRFPLRYAVAMLPEKDNGKYLSGSYFCILLGDRPELYEKVLVFGRVSEGFEVVGKLGKGDVIKRMSVERGIRKKGVRGEVEPTPERITR